MIRDGKQQRIAGREVVRDDVVLISEGDRIPADCVLLSGMNVHVDESLLTGESVPVRKKPLGRRAIGRPSRRGRPAIRLLGYVGCERTGSCPDSRNRPANRDREDRQALQALESEETSLQRQTARIVRNFALVGVSLCTLIVVVYGLTKGNWLHGLLAGITLAMATLPEEFPVALTVFLALGAWRISRHHVLTRRSGGCSAAHWFRLH